MAQALETPRYQREKLLALDTIDGPALIVQHNSTTIVPPGYVASVMHYGDMLISQECGAQVMTKQVDPITLQVIGGALHSIAEQMGNVLYRMSYSSIIRESQDLGAGLFDRDYNTLCESDSTPMHIGSLPGYLRGIEKTMPLDAWKPGDCVIHNHPYFGASHSPDIAIVMPVFFEGELVGFSANTAHHVDIGAATPGLVIDIPDVFAEGMLLNGLKLYNEGVRNEALWKYIRDNTRVPGLVMGDLEAQIASAELGVQRFIQLMQTYGKDTVLQATRQLMDYTETMLRREIAKIPDGDYVAEGFLDDDGRNRGEDAADQGDGAGARRRGGGRSHRVLAAGADRLQRAVRRLDQGRLLLRLPGAAARYLYAQRIHPAERRVVPAGEGDGAARLDLQSDLACRRGSPLQPDPARGRPDHQGAGAGAAGQMHGRQCRRAVLRRLFGRAAERRLLGVPRGERGGDGRPAAAPTAPTPSRS